MLHDEDRLYGPDANQSLPGVYYPVNMSASVSPLADRPWKNYHTALSIFLKSIVLSSLFLNANVDPLLPLSSFRLKFE